MNTDASRDHERDQAIDELAREYHSRCEAYDRTVCTGGLYKDGTVRPANMRELSLVGNHARGVYNELASRAPCSREDFHKAIQRGAK